MDQSLSAHGLGGAKDLPIPAEFAILGAVAALLISFTVLALAWRTPRFESDEHARPLPTLGRVVDAPAVRVALRVVGLLAFALLLVPLVFGQDLDSNPVFGMLFVLIWVGIVPLSLAFGPVWKAISPFRSINWALSRLLRIDPEKGLYAYPVRLGLWPAALGLYAFVWFELVLPNSNQLGPFRLWITIYCAVLLIGALLHGNRFLASADPFEVYSSLLAKVSPWGRRKDRLVLVSPLRNLATLTPVPGLVAVVAVLLGSTAYDSFRESPQFVQFVQGSTTSASLLTNVALLAFCVLAGLILVAGTTATGVRAGTRRGSLPPLFAHSMVPIVVGYMVAHYFTYFVFMSQDTLIKLSDPLSRGDNWFGTADWAINWSLGYQATFVAVLKVTAVVTGHVLGAVSSHDRALTVLPPRHHVTGQLPLLAAMVVFTAGGLFLLFAS